jgi:hypothetical protein
LVSLFAEILTRLETIMTFKNTSVRRALTCASILATLIAGPVLAENQQPRLTVAFVTDAAQGKAIAQERYAGAVSKLERSEAGGLAAFYVANNLCVSYLKIGATDKARAACDRAIDGILELQANSRGSRTDRTVEKSYQRLLAMALSNRGVVFVVDDMPEQARHDFNAAIKIQSGIRQPKINLARLEELDA